MLFILPGNDMVGLAATTHAGSKQALPSVAGGCGADGAARGLPK